MSRRILCKVLLVAVSLVLLLAFPSILMAQGHSEEAFERVKQVQERHTERLLAIEGVEGTAVGLDDNDQPAVKVFLEKPGVAGIPKKLDDVPVQVEVTGKFYALVKPQKPGKPGGGAAIDPRKRFARPVPIGVSTGNEGECSAGTIGCRVKLGGSVCALSNNHVYALCGNAFPGSGILQPGRYDAVPQCTTYSEDVIGTLAIPVPIIFSTSAYNQVDAAIALSSTENLGNATPSNGYGTPKTTPVTAYVRQAVQKYGRTTSLTKGKVAMTNATVNVNYGDVNHDGINDVARFVSQIVISPGSFSAAGDSGSLIVTDPGRNPVGLLFAGSSLYTIANPIDLVCRYLGVAVDGE